MRHQILQICLSLGILSFAAAPASGQQVVHATTGVVTAINAATKTIHVDTDDGSEGLFAVLTNPKVPLEFAKSIKATSTPAVSYTGTGSETLVLYFGDNTIRTVVALQDLGPGPFIKAIGTMIKLDHHSITIKNAAGAEQVFQIDAKSVGEGSNGVIEGRKFDADKGAQVRILATTSNGVETAVFIRAMTL